MLSLAHAELCPSPMSPALFFRLGRKEGRKEGREEEKKN